jgi:hypothetical protein
MKLYRTSNFATSLPEKLSLEKVVALPFSAQSLDKRIVAAVTAGVAADVAPAVIWLLTGKRAKKDTLPVQRLDEETVLKKVSSFNIVCC